LIASTSGSAAVAADDLKEIGGADEALRQAGRKDRIFQIRPAHEIVNRGQAIEIDGPWHLIDVVLTEGKLLQQEAHHVFGAIRGCFEAHCSAVAALREFALERMAQIVDRFIIHEEVGVARHAELITAEHLDAGEELMDEGVDDG